MQQVIPLPPPNILHDPAAIDDWYYRLTPLDRGRFMNHLQSLIDAMPPRRRALFDALMSRYRATQIASTLPGLGAWGAVVGGLVSTAVGVGVSVYNNDQQLALQKDLAADANMSSLIGTTISATAQKEIQEALAQAQLEAAKIAGQSQVDVAKQTGQVIIDRAKIEAMRDVTIHGQQRQTSFVVQHGKWLAVGGAALGGAALLAVILRKRRRSK